MKKLMVCVVIAAAACGGSQTAPKAPAAESKLSLAELSLFWNGDKVIKLHADGSIEVHIDNPDWKKVGTLTADGKFVADGKEFVHIADDGTLVQEGKPGPLKLENAALVGGGKKLSLDDKGNLQMDPPATDSPDWKPVRIEGITDAGTKRAALMLVAMLFLERSEPERAPAPATTVPAAVAPAPTL